MAYIMQYDIVAVDLHCQAGFTRSPRALQAMAALERLASHPWVHSKR